MQHAPDSTGRRRVALGLALAVAATVVATLPFPAMARNSEATFERIATMPVTENEGSEVAEIIAASTDGETVIYTDSAVGAIGFVDISDASDPQPDGLLDLGLASDTVDYGDGVVELRREPTSVAVVGGLALVGVNVFPDADGDEKIQTLRYLFPRGELTVVDIATREIIHRIPMGGQPDSVAVSPNGRFAAVIVENERNEELGEGEPPQLPAGFLNLLTLEDPADPTTWAVRMVDLNGLSEVFPEDAEPEYVDISNQGIAAVTLQENNHVAMVDVRTGAIKAHWSAGAVDLDDIDTEDDGVISLDGSLDDVIREPDSVTWIGNNRIATANEGDLFGGSRGFSIFDGRSGDVTYDSGNTLDHLAVRHGHYPDSRSDAKGNEPEGIEYGEYPDRSKLLFVGSERANFVAVYDVAKPDRPRLRQFLPTPIGPEGLLAIPERNLFVVSSETADGVFESAVSIYRLREGAPTYPTILSADGDDGLPLPWGALSALAADPDDPDILYSVEDSYYERSSIFTIDVGETPAVLTGVLDLKDGAGLPVDYDAEGIAVRPTGGWWIASEGAATFGHEDYTPNLLLEVAADGTVVDEVELPPSVTALQRSNGYEGVAVTGSGVTEQVHVAFQREWDGDPAGHVRIGRYTPATGAWAFFSYPLDAPESPAGGWVGLSEITAIDDTTFAVIERDNQGSSAARIKRIATFSTAGLTPAPQGGVFPVLTKQPLADVLDELRAPGGQVLDKLEGLALTADGDWYAVTDNDGVDEATGETQFLRLGDLLSD